MADTTLAHNSDRCSWFEHEHIAKLEARIAHLEWILRDVATRLEETGLPSARDYGKAIRMALTSPAAQRGGGQ